MSKLPSMYSLCSALLLVSSVATASAEPTGIDVSGFQGSVDWVRVATSGVSFVYIKATEGSGYVSDSFADQYDGAYDAGLTRGAYHFARPDRSSGRSQADFFVDNGGGWAADGQTLPGVLDLEYNPAGATCYDLSAADMVAWIHDFSDEYQARTGRPVVIYTTADWWNSCTDSATEFAAENLLWVAEYGASRPTLPAGWTTYTFWQYASTAPIDGITGSVDVNSFNGDADRLLALAKNTP